MNFINLAKKGLEVYESSQQGNSGDAGAPAQERRDEDGGDVQDRRHHEPQGMPQLDRDEIVNSASNHAGGSGDTGLFASAMSHLTDLNKEEHARPVDEEHVTSCHQKAYDGGGAKDLDAGSMGAAAAMQAFKAFTSGGSGGGGGGGSSQLISLAMGEASKLFDSSGGPSSGGKQDVVNSAAATMMKLVVQSKMGGGGIMGGGDSGGLGGLMGLAQKLL